LNDEPLTIRPGDIIPRPANVESTGAAEKSTGSGFMEKLKNGLKQAQEIQKQLKDLGIDVDGLFGKGQAAGLPGAPVGGDARPPTHQDNIKDQLKGLIVLLQVRYGDIPLNELLVKLKADYGNKKLSDFTRGLK
jgi:hypothetical protein